MTALWRYIGYHSECSRLGINEPADGVLLVLFVDADNLKQINDSLGHHVGDALIAAVASAMTGALPPEAVICRKGGDEFLAALRCTSDAEAQRVAEELVAGLNRPCPISDHEIMLSCSVGASIEPLGRISMVAHERNADTAMYWAKRSGKGMLKIFDRDDCYEISVSRALSAGFPAALMGRELSVAYQPIYRFETRKILGVEALVRWHHPEFGDIAPERVIQIATKSGKLSDLGKFVLLEACRAALHWPDDCYVSVNFVAADFLKVDFARDVLDILEDVGFPPQRLRVELTETEMLELNDIVLSNIHTLRSFGIKLGIDDFGTGHSSMGSIDSFPADFLKIDRSLVAGCDSRISSKIFIKAIKSVAEKVELELIAEGVETLEESAVLRCCGISAAQGYYFSRPTTEEELLGLFESRQPELLSRIVMAS